MIESLYVDFRAGQVLEIVPKPGFRCTFEAAGITKALTYVTSDQQLTIGDPEGIRTADLHRDRVAC